MIPYTTLTATRVTVTTSATLLSAASGRSFLSLRNLHATDAVFIGASDVTSAAGYSLAAGATLTLEGCGAPVYGITASGTISVSVLAGTGR